MQAGTKYKVEIIDTWNMTVTEYPGTFEVGKTIDYRHYDCELPESTFAVVAISDVAHYGSR